MAAPRDVIRVGRHRAVGCELRGIDHDRNATGVRGLDEVVDRRQPSGDVRRGGDGEQPWAGPLVELGDHVVDPERAVAVALDEPAPAQPAPRQQVGVVLHNGRDDDVV